MKEREAYNEHISGSSAMHTRPLDRFDLIDELVQSLGDLLR